MRDSRHLVTILHNVKVMLWLCNNFTQCESCGITQKSYINNFLQCKSCTLIAQQFYTIWKSYVPKLRGVSRGSRYLATIFHNVKVVHWLRNSFTQSESRAHLNLCRGISGDSKHSATIFYNVKIVRTYVNLKGSQGTLGT